MNVLNLRGRNKMKLEVFDKLIKEDVLKECLQIMDTKGKSYSGLEDKLGNFRRGSEATGSSMEQVWFIYFSKHHDALCSYIRGEYTDSEPIKGRIEDLICYLFLFCGILEEQGKLNVTADK